MATHPSRAMVLAAGLGERMRPLTSTMPKPLVKVAGQALLDHVLDRLAAAGVDARGGQRALSRPTRSSSIVAARTAPQIVISDERAKLLDTGGGVVKALPELGREPFFHVNSDTIWIDGVKPNLTRLAEAFDPATHGRAAAAGAGRDQHRLCRPRRLQHGGRRPADEARRARGGALRLCRRGDADARRCSTARRRDRSR